MHVIDEETEKQKNYITWSNHRKWSKIIYSDSNSTIFYPSNSPNTQNSPPTSPIYISNIILISSNRQAWSAISIPNIQKPLSFLATWTCSGNSQGGSHTLSLPLHTYMSIFPDQLKFICFHKLFPYFLAPEWPRTFFSFLFHT